MADQSKPGELFGSFERVEAERQDEEDQLEQRRTRLTKAVALVGHWLERRRRTRTSSSSSSSSAVRYGVAATRSGSRFAALGVPSPVTGSQPVVAG